MWTMARCRGGCRPGCAVGMEEGMTTTKKRPQKMLSGFRPVVRPAEGLMARPPSAIR
jgi:hypothetical protein